MTAWEAAPEDVLVGDWTGEDEMTAQETVAETDPKSSQTGRRRKRGRCLPNRRRSRLLGGEHAKECAAAAEEAVASPEDVPEESRRRRGQCWHSMRRRRSPAALTPPLCPAYLSSRIQASIPVATPLTSRAPQRPDKPPLLLLLADCRTTAYDNRNDGLCWKVLG